MASTIAPPQQRSAARHAAAAASFARRCHQGPRGDKLDWVPGAVVAKYHADFVGWTKRAQRECPTPAAADAFRAAADAKVAELGLATRVCVATDRGHEAMVKLVELHARAEAELERLARRCAADHAAA